MNIVREIERINERDIANALDPVASWHADYRDCRFIFVGGLDERLTEGDVVCVFSQYGTVADIELVRDAETGFSKGFAFLAYVDQRSTVLAVDNFNGICLLGRRLRVDHAKNYTPKSTLLPPPDA